MKLRLLLTVAIALLSARGWTTEATEYRFSPGDVIEVSIAPQSSFSRTVTVQPDGKISYPVVGQTHAAGLTVAALVETLTAGLSRQLVSPQVTVSLKETRRDLVQPEASRVSVLGAVRSPGVIAIRDGATIAEALAAAGGPGPRADLRRVTVTRANQTVTTLDLSQAERTGRLEQNLGLQMGDLVIVPEGARPAILVLGDVVKPGSYEFPREARLLDALSLAGGPTPEADLSRVRLTREGEASPRFVDLQSVLSGSVGAGQEANLPLQPGDAIWIEKSSQRIYLLGAVARPGSFTIQPDERVLDLLVRAGGTTPGADPANAVLVRQGEDGRPVRKRLNLKRMMAKGDMAQNETLRPGDLIYLPEKAVRSHSSPLDAITRFLFPVAGLLNIAQ